MYKQTNNIKEKLQFLRDALLFVTTAPIFYVIVYLRASKDEKREFKLLRQELFGEAKIYFKSAKEEKCLSKKEK